MNRRFLFIAAAGGAAVAVLVASGLFVQRGARLRLEGSVLKTRVHASMETSSAVFADFRASNPSSVLFLVRDVVIELVMPDGSVAAGDTVADSDAARYLAAYPELGQKFNPSLVSREKIGPRTTVDRMVAARFDLPERQVRRGRIRVRIVDVDGAEAVLESSAAAQ
jgi:hypothetical protein